MEFETDEKMRYRKFTSDEEATAWGMKYYGEWGKKYHGWMAATQLAHDEILENYFGYGHREVNGALRKSDREDVDEKYLHMADIMDVLLCNAPRVPENIIVYRHVSEAVLQTMMKKIEEPSYEDKGFVSTSLWPAHLISENGMNGKWLKIYVDAGVTGVYANAVAKRDEQELLLNRNLYFRNYGDMPCTEIIAGHSIEVYEFQCFLLHTRDLVGMTYKPQQSADK